MLLNDGGYCIYSRNVKFPVEVSGTKSVAGDCFIVSCDELNRVGFTIPAQQRHKVWWFDKDEAEEIKSCKIILLNDGGYSWVTDNVKFPVEVSGTKSVTRNCFIVSYDELNRVGFILPPQWPRKRWLYIGTKVVEIELCE
jgi:hypothetical protein